MERRSKGLRRRTRCNPYDRERPGRAVSRRRRSQHEAIHERFPDEQSSSSRRPQRNHVAIQCHNGTSVVEEIRRELLTASQQSLEIAARLSKRLEPPEAPTTTIELSQTSHEILFNSRTCLLQEMSMKSIVSEQRQKLFLDPLSVTEISDLFSLLRILEKEVKSSGTREQLTKMDRETPGEAAHFCSICGHGFTSSEAKMPHYETHFSDKSIGPTRRSYPDVETFLSQSSFSKLRSLLSGHEDHEMTQTDLQSDSSIVNPLYPLVEPFNFNCINITPPNISGSFDPPNTEIHNLPLSLSTLLCSKCHEGFTKLFFNLQGMIACKDTELDRPVHILHDSPMSSFNEFRALVPPYILGSISLDKPSISSASSIYPRDISMIHRMCKLPSTTSIPFSCNVNVGSVYIPNPKERPRF